MHNFILIKEKFKVNYQSSIKGVPLYSSQTNERLAHPLIIPGVIFIAAVTAWILVTRSSSESTGVSYTHVFMCSQRNKSSEFESVKHRHQVRSALSAIYRSGYMSFRKRDMRIHETLSFSLEVNICQQLMGMFWRCTTSPAG